MKVKYLIFVGLMLAIFTLGGVYASSDVDNMTCDANQDIILSADDSVEEVENEINSEPLGCSTEVINAEIIPVNAEVDYQGDSFKFQIVDNVTKNPLANKNVTLSGKNSAGTNVTWTIVNENKMEIRNIHKLTSDENGIVALDVTFYPGVTLKNEFSPADTYNMTITGADDINGSTFVVLKVNKIDINITVEEFSEYYDTDKKFTVVVTNSKTGKPIQGVTVNFNVTRDGEEINYTANQEKINSLVTNSEGKIELPANNLLPGDYVISTNVTNSSNYNANSKTGLATIKKIPLVINAENKTLDYGSLYSFNVTEDGNSLAGVYVFVRLYNDTGNYTEYLFLSNANGEISCYFSDVGIYNLSITSGDVRYDSPTTKNVTVTVNKLNPDLNIEIASVEESNPVNIIVKTNPMFSGNLSVQIGDKNYTVPVENGTGSLKISDLAVGSYSAKVFFNSSDIFNAEEKTVSFSVVAKKESVLVKKADKITLTLKKVKVKKSAKKLILQATLKINKKAKKGLKVTFKFNGKKYTAKTNAKGVAKVTIKKKVLKKLKVGKKVKYQVSYGKTTKKLTVKVKK